MSEAPIPAWKRAGLKRAGGASQAAESYDPLKEGLKRVHESGESKKPAKPPKRPKVAKSERPAPTFELDQLAYLRQYTEDRDNWKFSKQKQNWILKHMFTDINDDKYDEPLLNYIKGLQGSSRNWVCEDSRKVVDEWNTFMLEEPNKEGEEKEGEDVKEGESTDAAKYAEKEQANAANASTESGDQSNEKQQQPAEGAKGQAKKQKKQKKPQQPPKKKVPSEKMARRAQTLIKIIADEDVKLEFLDTEPAENNKADQDNDGSE